MTEPSGITICAKCFKANSDSLETCAYCGAPLPRQKPAEPAEEAAEVTPDPAAESAAAKFLFAMVLFAVCTGVAGYFLARPALKKRALASAVNKYYAALRARDYGKAYAMLSADSKRYCTGPRFAALETGTPTIAHEVAIFKRTDPNAVVKYRDAEGADHYTTFVYENDRWAKTYIPDLLDNTAIALDAGQPKQALQLAKNARRIDPLNPAVTALLCRAQYEAGQYQPAAETCAQTLQKQEYPANFSSSESATILYYLGSASLKLGLRDEAKTAFDRIAATPDVPAELACLARLARPQAEPKDANRDLVAGQLSDALAQCAGPERAAAQRMFDVLSGRAVKDAIAFGKAYRETPSSYTLEEMWKEQKDKIVLAGGYAAAPNERWSAASVSPGVYRVTLELAAGKNRRGKVIPPKNIWTLSADLWAGTIRMEQ